MLKLGGRTPFPPGSDELLSYPSTALLTITAISSNRRQSYLRDDGLSRHVQRRWSCCASCNCALSHATLLGRGSLDILHHVF